MATIVTMPEILTGMEEATIASWYVAEGDRVTAGTVIAEIETDKALVDFEAELEGWVGRLIAPAGATVAVGEPLLLLLESADEAVPAGFAGGSAAAEVAETTAEAADTVAGVADTTADSANPVPPAGGTPASGAPASGAPAPERAHGERVFSSPLARRRAREAGLDLGALAGTGPGGRILRADVEEAIRRGAASAGTAPAAPVVVVTEPAEAGPAGTAPAAAPAAPAVATPADYEDIPHSKMRKAIARRLTGSKSTVPHFYVVAECRVDELLELRRRINDAGRGKVSVNDFVLKAVAVAFAEVPEANAIWTEEAVRRYRRVDVGVAVATDTDLVTPVVRDLAALSVREIAESVRDLASRARERRLKQYEIEGGTFAVSNLGMYGTREFSAILNPPHSGILAVGAARKAAVVVDDAVVAATVMTCTLSADHRVIDGALAARWLAAFQQAIENPYALVG